MGQLRLVESIETECSEVAKGEFRECRECAFKRSQFFPARDPEKKCAVCWKIQILQGRLQCLQCTESFPIQDGVPRFLNHLQVREADTRENLKEETQKAFGFEWDFYRRLGWDYGGDKVFDPGRGEIERNNFFYKGMVREEEFAGKVVLDAGCGNGRYSFHARNLGAEVIAVDLSESVRVAAENLARCPDVHIVQADIFNLPLGRNCFDRIFSIGVLMHTGDAKRALKSLVSHLKPGGIVSVHVYRKGNGIYEWVDKVIRSTTVRMSSKRLLAWSRIGASLARAVYATRLLTFGKPILYQLMNCFIRLEAAEHNVFDWYSAPVASHHTYREVFAWFEESNLKILEHRQVRKNPLVRLLASPAGGVTVKGALQS